MTNPYRSLQLTEANTRFEQLDVTSYDVRLDLSQDDATFRSITTVRFSSSGGETFVDLKPVRVNEIRLNGSVVDPELLARGRVPLSTLPGENELVVDAVMRFRNDGEGLHRSVDPADGRAYVYGMCFMDAAPSIFACFDQPDLKAPYTFHVTAPRDWTIIGNAPGQRVDPGVWEFDQTHPLSTYFVTIVAGPYHLINDVHDGIPLGLSARQSIARDLETDADELFTMTKQCFDEFHRLFGIRYPFGNYHQAFVPEFNAGAMENPGCVTFRDPLVFSSRVTRGIRIQRATTLAHELAHQWFGNITTPKWWDDLWLNESFAEYMGNRVTADVTQYDDAWTHDSHARRQWGLIADQRPSTHPVAGNGAFDATAALQDFDGISYAKGSSILKQLNRRLGDDVFFRGVVDHFNAHRFGNATMDDLFGSWERAGAGDLSQFTQHWLRTAGPDALSVDRPSSSLRCTPPNGLTGSREHVLRVALASPGQEWRTETVTTNGDSTPMSVGADEAVLLDPFEDTWALTLPDAVSIAGFKSLLPVTKDAMMRAAIWNTVRSSFHNAAVSPDDVLDLIEAGIPVEDNDDALGYTLPWAIVKVAPLAADRLSALGRIQAAARGRLETAEPGSTVQLAAFQNMVRSSTAPGELRTWLTADRPDGIDLDVDLRWRILVQLAVLGEIDQAELQQQLDAEPTAASQVEFARAVASLPQAEAKTWAWERFSGTVEATNYELEAIGRGMWRPGQEHLTDEYVDRYFAEVPDAAKIFSGWVLAEVAEEFFPITSLTEATLSKAQTLIDKHDLDLSMRRRISDMADELARRIAVKTTFG